MVQAFYITFFISVLLCSSVTGGLTLWKMWRKWLYSNWQSMYPLSSLLKPLKSTAQLLFHHIPKCFYIQLLQAPWTAEWVWRCCSVLHALHTRHILLWGKRFKSQSLFCKREKKNNTHLCRNNWSMPRWALPFVTWASTILRTNFTMRLPCVLSAAVITMT